MFTMDIYLRRDLVNLKREYQEVRQIVIFIVKTQCREPEVLQLVCSSLLKQGQDLALSKNAGEQMVRVGYSRELSISWVMETFCGLSVMTVTTSTFQFIMTYSRNGGEITDLEMRYSVSPNIERK